MAAAAYWWLSQVDFTFEARRPKTWQWQVPVERRWVSRHDLNRVRYKFHEGEKVYAISHQHVIMLWVRLLGVIVLFLACVGFAVMLGTIHIVLPHHIHLPTHSATTASSHRLPSIKPALPGIKPSIKSPLRLHWPHRLTIPWWAPLIVAGFCLAGGVYIWMKWASWFFIVTSERLMVLELPFPIFPFAEEDDNPIRLDIVKRVEVKGSSFRQRWNLAWMNISTYLQPDEDAVFKDLFALPEADQLKELINELTKDNSGDLDQKLAPHLKELTAAVRDNTEVQRRALGWPAKGDDAPTQEH
jgi:hypothetical protein